MGLPNGYTEVQYIESTGTQWINTGFKPNQNTRVKMDCNVIGFNSSDAFLFGARIAAGNTAFYVAADDDNAKWWTCFGSNQWSPNDTCTGKHSIDFNQNVLTLDEKNFTFEKTTFQSSYNLLLFATITNGNVDSQRGKMAVYSCQIYDDGNLIRDFIPCIDPTGAVGLYDLVGRKFYRNAGTGVFLAGPPKVTLPKGYTQLEYIQSAGTQYIDTEFNPSSDTRVDITCEPTATGTWKGIFGAQKSASVDEFAVDVPSTTAIRSVYGTEDQSLTVSTVLQKFSIIKNKNVCTVNGAAITHTKQTFTTSFPIRLFDKNSGGNAWGQISMKLYSCQIYDNGAPVRNFIPCKNPSEVVGLYDLIGKKFYTNAVAGNFTAGPEVIWPSNDAIYVKVNGIWKQIDGIKIL